MNLHISLGKKQKPPPEAAPFANELSEIGALPGVGDYLQLGKTWYEVVARFWQKNKTGELFCTLRIKKAPF